MVVMYLRRKARLAKFEQLINQSLYEPNRNLVQGPIAERKFHERFNEIRYEPPRHEIEKPEGKITEVKP